ncbi:MFS transporter [Kutzneria sp. 744]|uniref:MFS transporter n=1 Tax=Kutzneria sp. (strain 744) TaxID=345341 RepID=UPI0003EEE0B7|nr:MFS transporter [Kutzneria sp. 744]EWM18665.1 drug resistance transporter, EmrB/QacA family [Kutzneria sp. 744]
MSTTLPTTARARWLAFGVLCSVQLMVIIDTSIVNVALPSIQAELGFTQSGLGWITNAYTIAFGGLLLLSGRLGDLVGRKRMFIAGLGVFTLSSLLCGVSRSQVMLVAGRFLQGAGAAMAAAVVMGIVITLFTDPRELGKAIAAFSFVGAAGGSLGVLAGGFLTQGVNWHWVFFVNVPIGIAAALFAVPLVKGDKGLGLAEGVDIPGSVLVTAGLMLGVHTIVEVPVYGWISLPTLGFGGIAALLLAGFVVRQATAAKPLVPPTLFRSRNLTGANVVQLLMVAGLFSFNFLGALYLQEVLGYKPIEASLAFLPLALTLAVVSLGLSTRFTMKFGPRTALLSGLALIVLALLLAARAPVQADYLVDVLPMALLLGAGAGLTMPAVMALAMSVATPTDAGLASGVAGTSGQIGGALGLAVFAALASGRTEDLTAAGASPLDALNGGFHLAFLVSAGVVALGLVVGATVLRDAPMPAGPPT